MDRHIEYIDQKVEEYLSVLAHADVQDEQMKGTKVLDKISTLKERRIDYELLEKRLQESGKPKSAPQFRMLALCWCKVRSLR